MVDPVVMMDGSGNTASLCEIWPYVANAAASFDDPMTVVEQTENINININNKKRRQDNAVDDDDDDDDDGGVSTSNASTTMIDGDGKRVKTLAIENENSESKPEDERSAGKKVDNSVKQSEPPKDFIHVRARRGQATDSHSLAERARREKISERMKILQDIVPGCNKVIGKASVLDEIINYIQSLQQQVEFLSMKLEAVTSRSHPSPLGFPSKDCFSLVNNHSTCLGCRLLHSPQGNSVTDCHQNGCTCKSVAALKEHHDFH